MRCAGKLGQAEYGWRALPDLTLSNSRVASTRARALRSPSRGAGGTGCVCVRGVCGGCNAGHTRGMRGDGGVAGGAGRTMVPSRYGLISMHFLTDCRHHITQTRL